MLDQSIKKSKRPMQQVVMSCSYQKLPELRSSSFAVSLERDSRDGGLRFDFWEARNDARPRAPHRVF